MSTIFFNSITNLYERNNIFSEWLISPFKETDDEYSSLTHFYRYSSVLKLVNNIGHIANAVKLETIHLDLVYCYEKFPFQNLQVEILNTNIFGITEILWLILQSFFFGSQILGSCKRGRIFLAFFKKF